MSIHNWVIGDVIGDGFLFYRLNSQELGFIINYDIKYRMGRDAGE